VRLTREQVERLKDDAAERMNAEGESDVWQVYHSAMVQLCAAMDVLQGLRGVQIWAMAEKQLREQKGSSGLLVVVVPGKAAAGAGVATFPLLEVHQLRLHESKVKYFGDVAAAAFETAIAQATAGPEQRPNGPTLLGG